MAGVKCPRCGLFSPETAERCDSGYQFGTGPTGAASASPRPQHGDAFPTQVSVVDVNMPFPSMVVFMVKWAIASIPALLILILLGALATAVFGGILAGLLRLISR